MSSIATVTLDFSAIVAILEKRLILAQNRALLTVAALGSFTNCADVRPLLGVPVAVTIGDAPGSTVALRLDATAFAVGSALREAIDGIALLCEELWRAASIARATRADGTVTPVADFDPSTGDLTALGNAVLGQQKSFDGAGLPDKLERLERGFGIRTTFRKEMESINKARTCLTHRLGRVGPKDINDEQNKKLRVCYRALELYVVQNDGSEKALAPGLIIEGPASLMMRATAPRHLEFGLGEQVTVHAQDFMHMMSTLLLGGRELARSCGAAVLQMRRREEMPKGSGTSAADQ